MNEFVKAWTAPTVIITLLTLAIGGIIWGVQLNVGYIQNREDIIILRESDRKQTEQLNEVTINNARQSVLLEYLIDQVDDLEGERVSP